MGLQFETIEQENVQINDNVQQEDSSISIENIEEEGIKTIVISNENLSGNFSDALLNSNIFYDNLKFEKSRIVKIVYVIAELVDNAEKAITKNDFDPVITVNIKIDSTNLTTDDESLITIDVINQAPKIGDVYPDFSSWQVTKLKKDGQSYEEYQPFLNHLDSILVDIEEQSSGLGGNRKEQKIREILLKYFKKNGGILFFSSKDNVEKDSFEYLKRKLFVLYKSNILTSKILQSLASHHWLDTDNSSGGFGIMSIVEGILKENIADVKKDYKDGKNVFTIGVNGTPYDPMMANEEEVEEVVGDLQKAAIKVTVRNPRGNEKTTEFDTDEVSEPIVKSEEKNKISVDNKPLTESQIKYKSFKSKNTGENDLKKQELEKVNVEEVKIGKNVNESTTELDDIEERNVVKKTVTVKYEESSAITELSENEKITDIDDVINNIDTYFTQISDNNRFSVYSSYYVAIINSPEFQEVCE